MNKRVFLLLSFLISLTLFNYLVLAYDLNGDNKVDVRDIVIVAKAFKTKPGDLNWNPKADLDGNGRIDINDINKVANNWKTRATLKSEPTGLSTISPLSIFSNFASWLSSLIGITAEEPSPTTKVYIDPIEIKDSRLTSGNTFTVDINLYDVANLVGWQSNLKYNPAILQVTEEDVVFSDFLGENTFSQVYVDIESGVIGLLALVDPQQVMNGVPLENLAVSGSGTLVTLTFHVIGQRETDLHLYDVILADPNALEIKSEAVDGYFNNINGIQYSKMIPSSGTIVY
jgi:hypothetical protein